MKKLPKKLVENIEGVCGALEEVIGEAHDYYNERSEKWQASDTGNGYYAWIESLEQALDALQCVDSSPNA